MCKRDDNIKLTFVEANQMFGCSDISQGEVLKSIDERQKQLLSPTCYHEIRFLLKTIKVISLIRSDEVRELIRSLNKRFLTEQYRGKLTIDSQSLHYLFSIIWYFRHCRNLEDVDKAGRDPLFISTLRRQLMNAGIAVQLEIPFT